MKYRYPGIRAFEYNDKDLFFGRKEDVKKLYTRVKAQSLVVLFAKSGIGKSSLLNAGLLPLLDVDLYHSTKMRFQDVQQSPLKVLKAELSNYLNPEKLSKNSGQNTESSGLWEYLKACEFPDQRIPILIFDQFEEFFEHPLDAQVELLTDLADLISERLPKRIQESLRAIPFTKRSQEDLAWHSPIEMKVVFAIRSDRLSLLDELSEEIPMILSSRYHLKPLQKKQATEAIVQPALLEGNFNTPPFQYQTDTLNRMLNYLSNQKGEIESFQLQLVCQHVEREVAKKQE